MPTLPRGARCFSNVFPSIRFYNHITHIYLQKPRKLEKISSHRIQYHFQRLRKALPEKESTLNHFYILQGLPAYPARRTVHARFQRKRKINVSEEAIFQNTIHTLVTNSQTILLKGNRAANPQDTEKPGPWDKVSLFSPKLGPNGF